MVLGYRLINISPAKLNIFFPPLKFSHRSIFSRKSGRRRRRRRREDSGIETTMRLLLPSLANSTIPICNYIPFSELNRTHEIKTHAFNFPVPYRTILPARDLIRLPNTLKRVQSSSNSQNHEEEKDDSQTLVEDLRVPDHWLASSKALEESEWLRVTLNKWLDDEYCPEATNVEISKIAARSYYNSLLEKQTDLGEILLRMASELESISYQESFHGAFSSANAAVSLIVQRIEQD